MLNKSQSYRCADDGKSWIGMGISCFRRWSWKMTHSTWIAYFLLLTFLISPPLNSHNLKRLVRINVSKKWFLIWLSQICIFSDQGKSDSIYDILCSYKNSKIKTLYLSYLNTFYLQYIPTIVVKVNNILIDFLNIK